MAEKEPPKSRPEFEAMITAKAWQDDDYRKRLVEDPRSVIDEEIKKLGGPGLPEEVEVNVVEEGVKDLYIVIPPHPGEALEELSDEQLEAAAGGTVAIVVAGVATVVAVGVNVYTYVK